MESNKLTGSHGLPSKYKTFCSLVLLLLVLGMSGTARAESKNWAGPSFEEGDWFDEGNWSPTGVPTESDGVTIDSLYPFNPNAYIDNREANVSSIVVGTDDPGILEIRNGGILNSAGGVISFLTTSFSQFNGAMGIRVLGPGSQWIIADPLEDPFSPNLFISTGVRSDSFLTIQDGGVVSNGGAWVGFHGISKRSAGQSDILVDGPGSQWINAGDLIISDIQDQPWSYHSLDITNGGEVTSRNGEVGTKAFGNSSVSVSGSGSAWHNSMELIIGDSGDAGAGSGFLFISWGGVVTDTKGTLGLGAGSSGSAFLNGGSWTNSSDLVIGDSGTGSLSISNGGTVHVGGTVTLAKEGGSFGTLSMTDGILNTASVTGGAGTAILNFYHPDNDYFFTNNGTDGGAAITITGTTAVNQFGSGTTFLTGNNTYTGLTTIDAGTLQIGNGGTAGTLGTGNTVNNSALVFNRSDASSYAGNISGTGTLTQKGADTLILTGTNTYAGLTTIDSGILVVNGSNRNSRTRVNAGGTLGGAGTVGSVNVKGGTFAPGNSIGTTTVAGNVDFTGGGIYQVEVDAAGNSDLIKTAGTATLTSGTVNVQPEAGTYNFFTGYTILTADGGLGGTTFNTVNSTLAFLTPTLSYDAQTVFLNLTRNDVDFAEVAGTPNQKGVANALTNMGRNPSSEVKSFLNKILSLSGSGAQQTFQSLTGVQHTQGQSVSNTLGQKFQQLALNRGSQSQSSQLAFNAQPDSDPLSGILLAYNGDDWMTLASSDTLSSLTRSEPPERGLWLRGLGGVGSARAASGSSGSDYDYAGFAAGADTQWHDFVFGVAAGYARSHVDSMDSNLDMNNYHLAGYGTWKKDALYVNSVVGVGMHQTDARRSLVIGSDISTAMAEYNAYDVSLALETGKDIALSSVTTLTPYIGAEYLHSNREAFTETGAGVASLSVDESDQDSVRSSLGLRIRHDILLNEEASITPFGNIAYVRELTNNVSQMNAAFAASPAATFQVEGSQLDRDRLIVGLGVIGQFNKRISLNIDYSGEFAQSDESHSFYATLRFTW